MLYVVCRIPCPAALRVRLLMFTSGESIAGGSSSELREVEIRHDATNCDIFVAGSQEACSAGFRFRYSGLFSLFILDTQNR